MTKMRKTFIALLTVVMLACVSLFAVACSSGKSATGIEITTAPTKTDYIAGEKFDPAGMVVSLVYENDKTKAVEDYTYSPDGELKVSDKSITVTYTTEDGDTYTAKQNITVHNDVTEGEILKQPNKTTYVINEVFDPTGMQVKLTYEDETTVEVDITKTNATYKQDPLTGEEKDVEVVYSGYTFKVEINFLKGVFIEAEYADASGVGKKSNDNGNGGSIYYTDSTGYDDAHNASNGVYVGDLTAGEYLIFNFISDKAGTAELTFRLASQWLRKGLGDWGWDPVWTGDCPLAEICKITANGKEVPIGEDVILEGGGSEDSEVIDATLWFNWKEITFTDVELIEGLNSVKLEFIQHSLVHFHEDRTGKFAANVDCMKVTSSECTISLDNRTRSWSANSASLVNEDNKAVYVVNGTYTNSGYTEEEIIAWLEKIPLILQKTGDDYKDIDAIYPKVTLGKTDDGTLTYVAKYDVTNVGNQNYASHLGGSGADYDFKPAMDPIEVGDLTVTVGNKKYTMYYLPEETTASDKAWGCVGLTVEQA